MIKVTKVFNPHRDKDEREFNLEVTRTFGKHGVRWQHKITWYGDMEHGDYSRRIEYTFNDPQDATLFALRFGDKHNG